MKLSSCRVRIGPVVVGCRCALTCTYSTVQYRKHSGPPPLIFCFFLCDFPLIFFSSPRSFPSLLLLLLASPSRARLGLRRGFMSADHCLSLASGRGIFHIRAWLATGMGEVGPRRRRGSGERERLSRVPAWFSLPRRWRCSGRVSEGKAPRIVLAPGGPEEHASSLFPTSFLLLPGISLATIVVPVRNARGDGTSRRHRQHG